MSSAADHTIFQLVEAPSIQAVENFVMERGMVSFNTITFRHVIPVDEVLKSIKINFLFTSTQNTF